MRHPQWRRWQEARREERDQQHLWQWLLPIMVVPGLLPFAALWWLLGQEATAALLALTLAWLAACNFTAMLLASRWAKICARNRVSRE